jgi:hypothetical protein
MSLSRLAVQELYTSGIDRYSSFITAFRSPQGIQTLLQRSDLLRPGLRVLRCGLRLRSDHLRVARGAAAGKFRLPER